VDFKRELKKKQLLRYEEYRDAGSLDRTLRWHLEEWRKSASLKPHPLDVDDPMAVNEAGLSHQQRKMWNDADVESRRTHASSMSADSQSPGTPLRGLEVFSCGESVPNDW
jgi:hypothetical protein